MKLVLSCIVAIAVGFAGGVGTMVAVIPTVVSGAVLDVLGRSREFENLRAGRARCEGQHDRALIHAWNLVSLYGQVPPAEFQVRADGLSTIIELFHDAVRWRDPSLQRAMPILAAQQRAALSLVLEEGGKLELAQQQWGEAQRAYSKEGQKLTRENIEVRMQRECAAKPWAAHRDLRY